MLNLNISLKKGILAINTTNNVVTANMETSNLLFIRNMPENDPDNDRLMSVNNSFELISVIKSIVRKVSSE